MIRTREDEVSNSRPFRPSHIGIVGDGVAGHLTALALKEWRPELEVTLIASPATAERLDCLATTPSLLPFLYGYLAVDPARFEREVAPTFKLGTRFEWGLAAPAYFNDAYAHGDLGDAQVHDGNALRYAVSAQLMSAGKAPFAKVGDRVIPLVQDTRFGWHVDEARFVAFLRERAIEVGVDRITAALSDLEVVDGTIARGLTRDGRVLGYDLWIDCTGATSQLLGGALAVPYERYDLPCDTVLSATVATGPTGPTGPAAMQASCTTVTTMNAGWAWHLPLRTEARVGYVHSARFITPDAARAELVERFPGARDFRSAPLSPGRHRDCISGNVMAIGDAYARLESPARTSLQMTLTGILRLIELLADAGQNVRKVNAQTAAEWDWLRSFLAVQYRFNRRLDTPFWREVHMTTDWSALEATLRDHLTLGLLSQRDLGRPEARPSAAMTGAANELVPPPPAPAPAVLLLAAAAGIDAHAIDVMLLGLGLVPERLAPATSLAEWNELMSMRAAVVACALPQPEAWPLLDNAQLWNGLVNEPRSWCQREAAELHRAYPSRGRSQEALAFWTRELGVPSLLGRDAARMPDDFPTSPNIDFGKFLKKVPEVVLRPRDQAQLAECLQMCARRRMPMVVRGAGHSSGGQALADRGALIDLRWLKRIIAEDQHDNRIRIESGLWWLELCGHLRPQGRRPLVLTDNWRSTVGGTLAVGGFGDASHREGLQIAGVRELMVMTVDGTRHRVRPGDDLYDWSLAGRGQLGIITEILLETTERGYELDARVLGWPSLDHFVEDARIIVAEGRFDWLRARLNWRPGAPVGAAAGHLGKGLTRAADFTGLGASQGQSDTIDLYDKSAESPDGRWSLACPGVEVIVPGDAAGVAAVHEINRRISGSELARYLPRGSSIMALSGRDAQHFPMAPLPAHDLVLMLAVRPEIPTLEVARYLPLLRGIADLALDAGGKVYLMGLEPTRPRWLEAQLGKERYQRLVALKAKWDPDHLLNPGLVPRT